ncbi:uncharacterized protein LOC111008180 [Momordica charantia]|uniref:Uncharacterized protein LOC111008180 n=1 Tax=Momordica charantia TaxID=3673 RepID=A0A6J1C3L6_MOMCH|nr:uncharacterized protein LOC111008180 [Momordica charantia]
MDSSGSMQSSSGGDEEYESRADSLTAAFITHHGGSLAGNFHHPPQSSSMFDPLSNLFDPRPSIANSNPNPLLNLDMVWSRTVRSDQIPPDLGAPAPNSSAVNHNLPSLSNFSAPQNFPHPPEGTNSMRGSGLGSEQTERDSGGGGGGGGSGANVVRSSKKRPRASRRAPTTVLTTDTTNFRAMVQEFTGIPAPPFTSSSSPFARNTRFDLFGTAAAAQPYLLRPFAQKPAFLSPSPPSNFLAGNLQTPAFDGGHFHNMFPSNPKLISKASSSTLEILQNNDQNLKMGIFEEFGLSTQGLPPAGEALPSTTTDDDNNNHRNPPPPARWVPGDGGETDQQALNLRSGNGNSNGKLIRYGTGNSSEFLGDKAAENVTTARSEGMVEPWICSSD